MRRRSWRWLQSRITSLGDRPPTYFQYLSADGKTQKVAIIPSTRLGMELNPPTLE